MSRVLVDTNVLVSYLTDRDPRQQKAASELLESAAAGEREVAVHQMVLTEMVYVLSNLYRVSASEIAEILRDLLALPGVKPIDEVVWSRVLELWPSRIPDFADAALASVAARSHGDRIATFDRRFMRRLRREGLESFF